VRIEFPIADQMSCFLFRLSRLAAATAVLSLSLLLDSCSSSSKKLKGVPENLPVIDLHGSASTPSHSMPRDEYPFDSSGNYVSSWAAEGESKAGRGAATNSDINEWKDSHHKDRGSSSSSGKKPKSGSASKSKDKDAGPSKKKTSGGKKHTVKSGDTLSSIARKYGTSVAKLKAANGLKSDVIRDGRTLSIP
jgi:hypothetical protein